MPMVYVCKNRIESDSFISVWKDKYLSKYSALCDQAIKCTRRMPWQSVAMKDVEACDKPREIGTRILIRGFPNGETHLACKVLYVEFIDMQSTPGELKHLSTRRKRNQPRFPK